MKILLIFFIIVCSRSLAIDNLSRNFSMAADIAEVPVNLLKAVCFVESNHKSNTPPTMDNGSLSYGMCQVKFETAKHMDAVYHHKIKVTRRRLQIPFINAFYAAKILKYQLKRYKGNQFKAIEAYNKGHAKNNGQGKYVNKVMRVLASQIKETRSR